MFSNQRWYVVMALLVLTAILWVGQAVWAHRGFRFDYPILDLIEICPDHMTFGFALENDPDGDIDVSTLSDPSVVVTATISQVVEFGATVYVTDLRFDAPRIIDENDDPIGAEGAKITVNKSGVPPIDDSTIYYAKNNWLDYNGDIDNVLKLPGNQTGFVVVTFPTPLEPGTELKLKFDVATEGGAHITVGTYEANLEVGLSMQVPTNCTSDTPTITPTVTPTSTNTPTNTPTATPTSTNTPTNTATITPTSTNTPTHMPTFTPTVTSTPTPPVSDIPTETQPVFLPFVTMQW